MPDATTTRPFVMHPRPLPRAPRVRLEITQQILDKACRGDSSHCMIADAVRAACPWATNVSVDIQTIRLTDRQRGLRYTYLTPRIAQLALVDFDAGVPRMQPFTCQLRSEHAHVSTMRTRRPARTSEPTPAQKEARQANIAKTREYTPGLAANNSNDDTAKQVAVSRVGGSRRAPIGALASTDGRPRKDVPVARRRTFGLRALDAARAARAANPE